MQIAQQLVVLVHLIGFAALFGGIVVQARSVAPEVNPAMLHGVMITLITGIALDVLALVGGRPVVWGRDVTALVITVVICVLVVANRRFSEIPRGLLALLGLGTLAGAAVGVLWT